MGASIWSSRLSFPTLINCYVSKLNISTRGNSTKITSRIYQRHLTDGDTVTDFDFGGIDDVSAEEILLAINSVSSMAIKNNGI